MSQTKTPNKEYEPIYIVDYLRSYPTVVELWEKNDALYHKMPPPSTAENHHVSNLLREYRECQDRKVGNKIKKEMWNLCAKHGLTHLIVHNGDKKGIQDLDGKKILPAIYDEFCITHDDIEQILPVHYYVCKKEGKWGIVDKRNKIRVPFEYDRIFRIVGYPYMFYVEKDGRKGLVKLTPFEAFDNRGKRRPKQEGATTFVIPCEMDEIYFIEHKSLFVFRKPNTFLQHRPTEEYKYGWYWETSIANPKSFSPCQYDELYIPAPWRPESPTSYDDDFFETRKGKEHEYIVIWTHVC
jgi:hypothetical protein